MYKISIWSAGHRFDPKEVATKEEVDSVINELQTELDSGLRKFNWPASHNITVTVFCIDVYKDGQLYKEYNLKKET